MCYVRLSMLLLVELAVLSASTVVSPLKYGYANVKVNSHGEPTSKVRAGCKADGNIWIFLMMLGTLHLALLVYGVVLVYQARYVSNWYSEGKYIAMAVINNLQVKLIGFTVMALCYGLDLNVLFSIESIGIIICAFGTLVLIFAPKIISVYGSRAHVTRTHNGFDMSNTRVLPSTLRVSNLEKSSGVKASTRSVLSRSEGGALDSKHDRNRASVRSTP